ncbi:hypothetical protein ACP4OV_002925 [Aristida adscensionis]
MRFHNKRVWQVLDANEAARRAYKHILARPTAQDIARNVVCLLLWLETIRRVSVLNQVAAMAADALDQVVTEANAIHGYLLHGGALPEAGVPAIVALCGGGRLVDLRFFAFHRDLVARGVAMVRDTVAALVFDDGLHEAMRRFEDEMEELQDAKPDPDPALMAAYGARAAAARTPPEDSRTAFVTFPSCHPLSAQDILDYFERRLHFGRCIDHVATERAEDAGQAPRHGVIVFGSPELRDQVMFHETAAFFVVKGHDMWVQAYEPPH